MNQNLQNTQKLAFGGMLAALVFAATYLFKIPISITQGYIHLGDAFILLGAVLLDWTAVPAAAIGSLLAVILAVAVIAAILTPPDVVSQILLALPMLLLYEVGVLIARVVKPGVGRERAAAQEEKEDA